MFWSISGTAAIAISWLIWGLIGVNEQAPHVTATLAVVGGVGGVVALVVSYRKQASAERYEGQNSIAKGVEQLGSSQASTRIAGVYTLMQIGNRREDLRQQIVDILGGYIRTNRFADGPTETTIFDRLRQSLDACNDQRWRNINLNLHGAKLSEPLSLSNCILNRGDFSNVIFSKGFSADQSVFDGRASFSQSRFYIEASFKSARFDEAADFSLAVFNAPADFSDCTFSSSISDNPPIPHYRNGVTDNPIWYKHEALFTGTQFHRSTDFSRTKFNTDCDFSQNVIEHGNSIDDVQEDLTEFKGRVSLTDTCFNEHVSFSCIILHSHINLTRTIFKYESDKHDLDAELEICQMKAPKSPL
jgi:uncharacterized protein YjbI with pentapeptide repeats